MAEADLLHFRGVSKVFQRSGLGLGGSRTVKALDEVDIRLPARPGILGLVGESGSGKTTLSRIVMGLESATSGVVLYRGTDVTKWQRSRRMDYRREVQMVFQDPYGAYNPFYRVDRVLRLMVRKFQLATSAAAGRALIDESLRAVGLRPEELLGRYPHQLSGGERQRFMLARVYLIRPKLIVADEPVSMLDASLRAMFLNKLRGFVELGMSCLYITHDLNIAYAIADRIVILCNGRVVEEGATERVVKDPLHPYTQELIRSIPTPDPNRRWQEQLDARQVGLHKLREAAAGNECIFAGRCPHVMDHCRRHTPLLAPPEDRTGERRQVACFLHTPAAAASLSTTS